MLFNCYRIGYRLCLYLEKKEFDLEKKQYSKQTININKKKLQNHVLLNNEYAS